MRAVPALFRRFNDVSIRNKLVVMVSSTVAILTALMLVWIGFHARKQVNEDVQQELQAARVAFVIGEAEHMHQHVLEAEGIARSDVIVDLITARKTGAACIWTAGLLSGKRNPIHPEEAFDLVAVVLPKGKFLGVADHRGGCSEATLLWRFPRITNTNFRSEITNWESPEGRLYNLVESPVMDAEFHDLGTLVLGYEISDTLAQHIKAHTGRDTIVWHMDGNRPHFLGSSNAELKQMLASAVESGGLDSQTPLPGATDHYSILDTILDDPGDIVHNPQGVHVALVQPLDEKFLPFRQLEYTLLILACIALALGLGLGIAIAHPIANPLAGLANVAECVAQGNLDVADGLMSRNPDRMGAKDEIGVLGRSFVRMIQGLKERLAMSTFLSDATFEHIRRGASGDSLSVRTSLVVLFADVRKFSYFAETRDPEEVIRLLNQVLSIEAETVKKHGGDVDKFVGDAVIAWFLGADRCTRAVRAANEMIANLRARFGDQPGATIGIGIHVGEVVIGSIGSATRRDYTAIGSTVNMASRLCSSAHPGQILVSQAVAIELGTTAELKPLAPLSLKGFSEPVPVFEANLAKAADA